MMLENKNIFSKQNSSSSNIQIKRSQEERNVETIGVASTFFLALHLPVLKTWQV